MRWCYKCDGKYPDDQFYKDSSRPDGISHRCKSCANGNTAAFRAQKPAVVKQHHRKYHFANKQARNEQSRTYYSTHPEENAVRGRRSTLKKYGLTLEDYARRLEEQNGVCALCGSVCKSGRNLAVDHHHPTNTNRMLLCAKCNTAVERLDSVPGWAAKAQEYVDKFA